MHTSRAGAAVAPANPVSPRSVGGFELPLGHRRVRSPLEAPSARRSTANSLN